MKVSGNDLRVGNVIAYQKRMYIVTKTQHTQPGKGGAYMCVILRDLLSGSKKDARFRSSESVERLFIEEKEYQFLYKEGTQYVFMNTETFDQIAVDPDIFNVSEDFLQENMMVKIGFHEGNPTFVTLPAQVVLDVVEADPVVKGQTASSSYKPARLSNGMRVDVPPHIDVGTAIVVNTQDISYVERFKKQSGLCSD
jgi:elongation factor P